MLTTCSIALRGCSMGARVLKCFSGAQRYLEGAWRGFKSSYPCFNLQLFLVFLILSSIGVSCIQLFSSGLEIVGSKVSEPFAMSDNPAKPVYCSPKFRHHPILGNRFQIRLGHWMQPEPPKTPNSLTKWHGDYFLAWLWSRCYNWRYSHRRLRCEYFCIK